jgi:catechol 2,3-dioxygenase-like lactoylglutathione lyase family enzyme
MIDHIGIQVTNLETSVAFYTRALAPLGYKLVMQIEQYAAGFGIGGKPDFWIGAGKPTDKIHVAILAKGRGDVRAFYDAAIAAGGTDNGPPGVREVYHPNYYGAFVLDPDGHNIEAVCHDAYLG